MKWIRNLLAAVIGIELVAAVVLIGLRLGATSPDPPPVALSQDALTGREILELPDRFRFDGAEKWRSLGEMYLAFGYFGKAEACLALAARSAPRDAETVFSYGYCLERLGKMAEAEKEFVRAAATAKPMLVQTCWYHIGRIRLRLAQPAEAEYAFLKAGDRHLPSVFQRAKLMVRHGRAAEAEPLLEILAEHHPRDLHVWQLRLRAAEALGREEDAAQARDEFDRAAATLALNDGDVDLNRIRESTGLAREIAKARERWNARAPTEAAEQYLRLVEAGTQWEPSFPYLQQDAAAAQVAIGNFSVATPLVARQFDEQDFPTPIAWQMRGDIDFAGERFDDADEAWLHAARMQPTADVYRKLARLAEKQQDESASKRYLALAGQMIGIDQLMQNQPDRAAQIFREAVALDSGLPHLWYCCGESERLLGNRAEAAQAYRRCLELNPHHGRALAALARLETRPQ